MPKGAEMKRWGMGVGWGLDRGGEKGVALLKYAFARICKVNANSLNSDTVILKRSNCGK